VKAPLNIPGIRVVGLPVRAADYFRLFDSCAATIGIHTPAKDSIPPASDRHWIPEITFQSTYGNKVEATQHSQGAPYVQDLSFLGGRNLDSKQVMVIRDADCNTLIISFVDREKEKELFGDEKERGIARVEPFIPEVWRKKNEEAVSKTVGVPA
jgi:hypothetical protein